MNRQQLRSVPRCNCKSAAGRVEREGAGLVCQRRVDRSRRPRCSGGGAQSKGSELEQLTRPKPDLYLVAAGWADDEAAVVCDPRGGYEPPSMGPGRLAEQLPESTRRHYRPCSPAGVDRRCEGALRGGGRRAIRRRLTTTPDKDRTGHRDAGHKPCRFQGDAVAARIRQASDDIAALSVQRRRIVTAAPGASGRIDTPRPRLTLTDRQPSLSMRTSASPGATSPKVLA